MSWTSHNCSTEQDFKILFGDDCRGFSTDLGNFSKFLYLQNSQRKIHLKAEGSRGRAARGPCRALIMRWVSHNCSREQDSKILFGDDYRRASTDLPTLFIFFVASKLTEKNAFECIFLYNRSVSQSQGLNGTESIVPVIKAHN